jgi:hypothetical protein
LFTLTPYRLTQGRAERKADPQKSNKINLKHTKTKKKILDVREKQKPDMKGE